MENPIFARRFFAPVVDEERVWDVIVVGSGGGGGTLADQLSDLGADVLVLEIGSYLFPTHVGNLPREQKLGLFDKHVWRQWYRYRVPNYFNGPDSEFNGANGFNLGGRTLFWACLTPRMRPWEMQDADINSSNASVRTATIVDQGYSPRPPTQTFSVAVSCVRRPLDRESVR